MPNRFKVLLSSAFLCFTLQGLFAQTFENSIGSTTKDEFTYDGKPLPVAKGFATVSNAPIFSAKNQWLFTRIDPTGHHTLNKVYGESNDIIKNVLEGRAIERVFGTADKSIYQAGARTHTQPARAVILLSDEKGTPLHAMQQFSAANTGEMATTLESVPEGVIVAGNAGFKNLQTANSRFFAARFKLSAGKLIQVWSFRYFDADTTKANFAVGKTTTGMVKNTPVVVITGSFVKKGVTGRHTFISCIDAGSGAELWRRYLLSGLPTDEGADVVQDPATRNFMTVGYAVNTAGKKSLYVSYLDENGAFLTGVNYATVLQGSEIVGQDVTLSNDSKSAVITGYVKLPDNNLKPNAFFVEIPFVPAPAGVPPVLPTYAKYYLASEAFTRGTSSIDRNDNANNTKGYFIATQSVTPGAAPVNYNIHVIDVENDGETKLHSPCDVKRFELKPERSGKSDKPKTAKEGTKWDVIKVIEKVVELPEKRCD